MFGFQYDACVIGLYSIPYLSFNVNIILHNFLAWPFHTKIVAFTSKNKDNMDP